jgi:hypothetical protein
MTDSNGKGPLYFVFLNDKKELIYAGTTDGINNDDDLNLNMVKDIDGTNQDDRIDEVVNKIMNNDTMEKYFNKNSSSVDESKDENKNKNYEFIFNSGKTLNLNDDENDTRREGGIPDILLPKEDGTGTTHKIVNVGGDGNCFFYALFYSILAICNNGKTASQLIEKMFDIHINVDDEHIEFAKDSSKEKGGNVEERNKKYKNTELYFATRMRLFLGKNEEFKNKVREEIELMHANENFDTMVLEYTPEFKDVYSNKEHFDYEKYVDILTSPTKNDPRTNNHEDNTEDVTVGLIQGALNAKNDNGNKGKIEVIKSLIPASDNKMRYPDASPEQVKFLKNYMNKKKLYIVIHGTNDENNLKFKKYNNVIRLYRKGNHYQYIIPESPSPSSGGGKRKTQRKRPKSSHKNKSIKTK